MLHQKTGIDRDKNGGREVAEESQELARRIRVIQRSFLKQGTGSRFTNSWDNPCRGVKHQETIGERDKNRWCHCTKNRVDHVESCMDDGGKEGQCVHESGVRRHDDGRQRGEISCLRWRRNLFDRMRGLVIGEDLINAQDDISKQEGAFHWISTATADPPCTQDHGTCDGNADQSCVDI